MNTDVRIRAITGGISLHELVPPHWGGFTAMYKEVEQRLRQRGLVVQTRRLVLEPIRPQHGMELSRLLSVLDSVTVCANESGVRWACLPISAEHGWGAEDLRKKSRDLIRRYPYLFVHHIMAEHGNIYRESLPVVAQSILDVAFLSNNGFDNFRMGVGANIMPNTPFFPFSMHAGRKGFSLAVEILGPVMAQVAAHPNCDTEFLRQHLTQILAEICREVDETARAAEAALQDEYKYKGIDISLAPYPDGVRSVSKLVEHISGRLFGEMGTLTATAFLTAILKDALAQAGARAVGFNGVMYSQLEDCHLAHSISRNVDMLLEQYMLYSTVCGCGIDMVPIAGNTLRESLDALLLDVATLSCRHSNKPLGVRVLPIPMKRVNEQTDFNHDFLVNSRILRA